MTHQMLDRDIHAIWTNSNKIHIEFAAPTEETLFTREDLLVLLYMLETECKIPPDGWVCSREEGHVGPCAARLVGVQ